MGSSGLIERDFSLKLPPSVEKFHFSNFSKKKVKQASKKNQNSDQSNYKDFSLREGRRHTLKGAYF